MDLYRRYLSKVWILCIVRLVGESDFATFSATEEVHVELDRKVGDELCDEDVDLRSLLSGRAAHRATRVRLTSHRLIWRATEHSCWLALRLDEVASVEPLGGVMRSKRCLLRLHSGLPVYIKGATETMTDQLIKDAQRALAAAGWKAGSFEALYTCSQLNIPEVIPAMVWLAITADSWDSVWKVKRQLEELGIASPGSVFIHGDGKIFLETSMEILLGRVVCLSMVERVFLCVHREGLHEEHAICHLGPNYKLLQEWIYAIDWQEVFRVIDVIHGGHRPATWLPAWPVERLAFGGCGVRERERDAQMLDSKRHGAKGSPMRAFDRLEMQQKVRDVLHEVLSVYGCSHHPYNAGLMVYVFLSASLAFVGVPILHRRVKQGYFPHKGLHHSLCWGLASVARLQDRELVLDPMAGKGVVLLEAAAWWPQCHFLGLELVSEQLVQAAENLRYANERGVLPCGQAVGFARADCRKLPLAAKCVDVVLCDLPYGRQYGTEEDNHSLYTAALRELSRVLKEPRGRAILITTATPSNLAAMENAAASAGLHIFRQIGFRFGGNKDRLRCAMFCLVTASAAKTYAQSELDELFDWSCIRRLENLAGGAGSADDGGFVWKAVKPLLRPYIPLKAAAGAARELVPVSRVPGNAVAAETAAMEGGGQKAWCGADFGEALRVDELQRALALRLKG
eukprot:s837_g10.t1